MVSDGKAGDPSPLGESEQFFDAQGTVGNLCVAM
jgi:hypothetical protein